MYAFNSAAIFLPGHPYIESTTVLSDYYKKGPTTISRKKKVGVFVADRKGDQDGMSMIIIIVIVCCMNV